MRLTRYKRIDDWLGELLLKTTNSINIRIQVDCMTSQLCFDGVLVGVLIHAHLDHRHWAGGID